MPVSPESKASGLTGIEVTKVVAIFGDVCKQVGDLILRVLHVKSFCMFYYFYGIMRVICNRKYWYVL